MHPVYLTANASTRHTSKSVKVCRVLAVRLKRSALDQAQFLDGVALLGELGHGGVDLAA